MLGRKKEGADWRKRADESQAERFRTICGMRSEACSSITTFEKQLQSSYEYVTTFLPDVDRHRNSRTSARDCEESCGVRDNPAD